MSNLIYATLFSVMTAFVAWHIFEGFQTGVMKAVIWGKLQADRRSSVTAFTGITLYNAALLIAGFYLVVTSI